MAELHQAAMQFEWDIYHLFEFIKNLKNATWSQPCTWQLLWWYLLSDQLWKAMKAVTDAMNVCLYWLLQNIVAKKISL